MLYCCPFKYPGFDSSDFERQKFVEVQFCPFIALHNVVHHHSESRTLVNNTVIIHKQNIGQWGIFITLS
jgi:hypothetical protein